MSVEQARELLDSWTSCVKELDLETVVQVVDELVRAYEHRSTVICVGNGGSAATATHFAADLGKFATFPNVGFRSISPGDNVAAWTAWVNDDSWDESLGSLIRPWLEPNALVVAFSVNGGSGYSSNLVHALELTAAAGGRSIGIAGNGGGKFAQLCDIALTLPTPTSAQSITPLTEAMHVLVHHLICAMLRERLSGRGA